MQKYEFAIRHLGRHVPTYGTSILILSEWSRTITITTELETPERPDAEQTGSGQLSLSWDPVADATQYRLRLWTEDRWEELDGEDDGGVSVTMSGTTATVSGLPGDYYWYIFEVQALGPNGVQQSGWVAQHRGVQPAPSGQIAIFLKSRRGSQRPWAGGRVPTPHNPRPSGPTNLLGRLATSHPSATREMVNRGNVHARPGAGDCGRCHPLQTQRSLTDAQGNTKVFAPR